MANHALWLRTKAIVRDLLAPGKGRSKPSCRKVALHVEMLEDRLAPAAVNFAVAQDWGSGFQATVAIVNEPTDPTVNNWLLEFDYDADIGSIWDARIVSHVGSHYAIGNAGWNSTLGPGGTVSFGFIGSPGSTTGQPANYVLNGVPLGGTPAPTLPALAIGDVTLNEGNSGTALATFTVRLSQASTVPVTVRYATGNGTATAGSDYQSASGILTFAPGELEKTIAVAILGDANVEPNETFTVSLSEPTNATIGDGQAMGTITNDDTAPAVGGVVFRVDSDWSSGFTGTITIRNSGSTPMQNWSLEFDYSGQISSIWNAAIVQRTGNHYVVQGADWNSTIAPGATVSFGFVASPGGGAVVPNNFVLNGAGAGGNQAPTTNGDTARTQPGVPVTINVLANDTDPNGDVLAVVSATQGQQGTVAWSSNGTVTYTPAAGFTGTDSFAYSVSDGHGGTANATVTVLVADPIVSTWPDQFFAPYVDMTLYPMYDPVAVAQNQGIKFYTLAFIVADARGLPSWGGYEAYEVNGGEFDTLVKAQLASLRSLGGDVMVSFGGAANQELAQVITNLDALASAYQSVIDAYQLTHIDFDIEGGAAADRASIDRRSQAIARLQQQAAAAGKELQVWFTLPVLPTGLTNDGLYVLQSALQYGVTIAGVNIMAMDYGDSAAPNPQGRMGDYAIQAGTSLFAQLQGLYGATRTDSQLWQMIGVTPMIGLNDVTTEVFDQQEASELLTWAEQQGIGRLSMWSLNRDRQAPGGALGYVDPTSSSILQQPFEFALVFESFTG